MVEEPLGLVFCLWAWWWLLYGLYDVQVLIYLIAWKSGELRCQAVTESSAGDRNPQLFRLLLVRMTLICLPNMQGKCDIQYEI